MPIRVSCQCGQVLNVPEAMAGKAGKCPKCSAVVRIPAAQAGNPSVSPSQTAKKPPRKPSGTPSTAKSGSAAVPRVRPLDDLFEEAGIVPKTGNFCPKCEAPVPAGAALCIKCGLNLSTGEVLTEHQLAKPEESYGNVHLDEAVVMMRRDVDIEKRTLNAGTPWWVLLCFLLAVCILCGAGIIIVDGNTNAKQPAGTFIGNIQRESPAVVVMGVAFAISCLVFVFAWLNFVVLGFKETLKWGFINLLIPPAVLVYGAMRFKKFKGTVKAMFASVAMGAASGIGLLLNL